MLRAPGATMDLIAQLRQQICSYLRGLSTLADLRLWLADHVQEISDAGDAELDELDGLIWVLVSELDYGHRAEESVRTELAAVVDPVQVTGGWAVEHMVASTTAAVIRTSSCFHAANLDTCVSSRPPAYPIPPTQVVPGQAGRVVAG
jgi:hypothetical protein